MPDHYPILARVNRVFILIFISPLITNLLFLPEHILSHIFLPLLHQLTHCAFPIQPLPINFVLFHQFSYRCIEVDQPPGDVCCINLPTRLLATIKDELGGWPLEIDVEGCKTSFEQGKEVMAKVEGISLDLFALVVSKNLFGDADLKTFLAVSFEDEEEKDEGAYQSSHIREESINFVELPLEL